MIRRSLVCISILFAAIAFAEQRTATIMQQIYVVKRAFPNLKTLGVLCNAAHASSDLKQMNIACTAYQLEARVYDTQDLSSLRENFDRMLHVGKVDVVWLVADGVADQKFGRRFLSEKCLAQKIPLCGYAIDHVREGALLAVLPDETGALKIYFNQKVKDLIAVDFSPEAQPIMIPVE